MFENIFNNKRSNEKSEVNPLLWTTPGRGMEAHVNNKSLVQRNRATDLEFSHKFSEILYNFIHGYVQIDSSQP